VRIVQLANLVSPTSGGIRTTIDRLRTGYRAAGHQTVLVIPGPADAVGQTAVGPVVQLRAPRLPASGGYRLLIDLRRVHRVLDRLAPDRVEVHDRFTLRTVGTWARARGVPSLAVVHERLDHLADLHLPALPGPLAPARLAAGDSRAVAARFDVLACPSRWAAQELVDAGVTDVEVVGWGVDLDLFQPRRRRAAVRDRLLGGQQVLLAVVCRLSPEKDPARPVEALRALRRSGVDARLVVAGTGRSAAAVRRAAAGLPVTLLGHVGRDEVADLLAAADVAVCPGPIETFGLAALEALASGTPVVSSTSGAIPELLAPAYGCAAAPDADAMAEAVRALLDQGGSARRAARAAAEAHPWSRAVARMLALHGLTSRPSPPHGPPPPPPPAHELHTGAAR
jgi:alpha-1,6-mannosyltransferase